MYLVFLQLRIVQICLILPFLYSSFPSFLASWHLQYQLQLSHWWANDLTWNSSGFLFVNQSATIFSPSLSWSWSSHIHWLWVKNLSLSHSWVASSFSFGTLFYLKLYFMSTPSGIPLFWNSHRFTFYIQEVSPGLLQGKTDSSSVIRNNHCSLRFLNSTGNLIANYIFKGNVWKDVIDLHAFTCNSRTYLALRRISSFGSSVFIITQMQYLKLASGHL